MYETSTDKALTCVTAARNSCSPRVSSSSMPDRAASASRVVASPVAPPARTRAVAASPRAATAAVAVAAAATAAVAAVGGGYSAPARDVQRDVRRAVARRPACRSARPARSPSTAATASGASPDRSQRTDPVASAAGSLLFGGRRPPRLRPRVAPARGLECGEHPRPSIRQGARGVSDFQRVRVGVLGLGANALGDAAVGAWIPSFAERVIWPVACRRCLSRSSSRSSVLSWRSRMTLSSSMRVVARWMARRSDEERRARRLWARSKPLGYSVERDAALGPMPLEKSTCTDGRFGASAEHSHRGAGPAPFPRTACSRWCDAGPPAAASGGMSGSQRTRSASRPAATAPFDPSPKRRAGRVRPAPRSCAGRRAGHERRPPRRPR